MRTFQIIAIVAVVAMCAPVWAIPFIAIWQDRAAVAKCDAQHLKVRRTASGEVYCL